ncbi:MAG: sodium:solute symporter family protein [Psychroserpens sp.]|uniref:sodium:solute symporter family protein n=1 Tax=Psychroserpens sp. TaxID=2020870 RepID=UPI003C73129F
MISFFIILYLLLTLGIGFWASKRIKTSGDFSLAGKSLSTPLVAVTLFATWFGSGSIMGNAGYFIKDGFSAYVTLILSTAICLVIVAFFYVRKLYRLNIVTVNDFFKIKYNKTLETTSSIIMVFSYPHWIAAQFVALAYLFNSLMGIPIHYGILLGASIVVFYTYIGGMWAVAYTDMVQSIMILIGITILLIEIISQSGGITPIFASQKESFFNLYPTGGIEDWSDYIALLLAFTAGAIPAQEIYQRVFSAKTIKSARNGLLLGGLLLVIVSSVPLIIGLGGVYLNPNLITNGDYQNVIPALVNSMMGLPVQILFYGALISALLSTCSGAMLAPASVIGENLIKPYAPQITDKKLLLYTRLSVVLVAIISCYFAYGDGDIVRLIEASLALILVCLFAPFTFGLFWKKASVDGAWCAMGFGGLTWFICLMIDTTIDPTIYGFISSCLGMLVGSLLKPDIGSTSQF